jgi:hypothetical protein
MDRRNFLMTSLAGAAPAHMLGPGVVGATEPKSDPVPAPNTDADLLIGLAHELDAIHEVVEGYSQLMLQKRVPADVLRRTPLAVLAAAERLRELTGELRARAGQGGR